MIRTGFLLSLGCLAVACATSGTRAAPTAAPVTLAVGKGVAARAVVDALQAKPYLRLRVLQLQQQIDAKAGPAPAKIDVAGKAGQALEQARTAYRRLRFDEAANTLARAQTKLSAHATGEEHFRLLQQLELQRGLSLLALRRDSEARAAFATALNLGYAGPEPGKHPPEVERRIRRVQNELAGAPRVGLTVKAQPTGSAIWVDGKRRGESPVTLQLAPGPHHIRVTLLGHRERTFFHRLTPGKSDKLEVYLKPLPVADLAQELRTHPRPLAEIPPGMLARVLGPDVAALEVEQHPVVQWTGRERLSPGVCPPGDPQQLADCLGPLLHRLATGKPLAGPASLAAPSGRAEAVYSKWWFWTLVGTGVAAAGTGAGLGIYYGTRDTSGTNVDITVK